MEFGFPVAHNRKTGSTSNPKNHKGATEFLVQMESILNKEVENRSVVGPFEQSPFQPGEACFSPLNSVPKRDSEDRHLILDLSFPQGNAINDGIHKDDYLGWEEKLVLPSIDKLAKRVRELGVGCKLFKIDLSRGHCQIYLDLSNINLLGYVFNGKFYFDCTWSMESRLSAKCCQRVTSAIVFIHAKRGYFVINYLDDLGSAEPAEVAEKAFTHLRWVLQQAGLKEASHKTVFPTTCMVFLGVEVNSIMMTLRIPPDKFEEIQQVLANWEGKSSATLKQVQQLAGLLNFACKCVKSGRIYLSRILNFLHTLPKFGARVIPCDVTKDIQWWRDFVPQYNGVSLITNNWWLDPDQVLSTDSCLTGGGCYFRGKYCHWKYPEELLGKGWDINQLECMMIVIACKLWGHLLQRQKVVIYCDNQVTVAAINSRASCNEVIQKCLRELHMITALFSFEIKTVYLLGSSNRISDSLSRFHVNWCYREIFWKSVGKERMEKWTVKKDMFQFLNID